MLESPSPGLAPGERKSPPARCIRLSARIQPAPAKGAGCAVELWW